MNIRLFGQCILQLLGLMYAIIKYNHREITVNSHASSVTYSLPFRGEWYVANGGVTKELSHSWDTLPQRFAFDFFIVDQDGNRYNGDKKNLGSYYCYGEDVLAPADGIVVAVKNRFPDCCIMDDNQTDPSTPDIGGNRIIIQHSDKEFSAICHLIPDSVVVKKGQTVNRGDVIAKCGNSGHTTEPHIHFQVQSTAGFYSSFGVPVHFTNISAKPHSNYDLIDSRPQPAKSDIVDGYIHRGLCVKNKEQRV